MSKIHHLVLLQQWEDLCFIVTNLHEIKEYCYMDIQESEVVQIGISCITPSEAHNEEEGNHLILKHLI